MMKLEEKFRLRELGRRKVGVSSLLPSGLLGLANQLMSAAAGITNIRYHPQLFRILNATTLLNLAIKDETQTGWRAD